MYLVMMVVIKAEFVGKAFLHRWWGLRTDGTKPSGRG